VSSIGAFDFRLSSANGSQVLGAVIIKIAEKSGNVLHQRGITLTNSTQKVKGRMRKNSLDQLL
jgi:hypothetical protein